MLRLHPRKEKKSIARFFDCEATKQAKQNYAFDEI
jgi:hypothetical protein